MKRLGRRGFIKASGLMAGAALLGIRGGEVMGSKMSRVALVKTDSRERGVRLSISALDINPVRGKDVLLKPNFNTADPTPGSTHNQTLMALVEHLWEMGARSITLGERSYPPTRQVMEAKGVIPLLDNAGVKVTDFDRLEERDWVLIRPKDTHWSEGFRIARPILEAECLVSTCCLKTHQYGGVFTMSLKLHVGVVPTSRHGYNYMGELHSSPHQRKMIAEINAAFRSDLIVLDGIDAFVDGGPATGKLAQGNVFLASTDRIAIDATGVAILKLLGSNEAVMRPRIFEQEQIARAVELGLGAPSATSIDVIAADEESRPYAVRVSEVLRSG